MGTSSSRALPGSNTSPTTVSKQKVALNHTLTEHILKHIYLGEYDKVIDICQTLDKDIQATSSDIFKTVDNVEKILAQCMRMNQLQLYYLVFETFKDHAYMHHYSSNREMYTLKYIDKSDDKMIKYFIDNVLHIHERVLLPVVKLYVKLIIFSPIMAAHLMNTVMKKLDIFKRGELMGIMMFYESFKQAQKQYESVAGHPYRFIDSDLVYGITCHLYIKNYETKIDTMIENTKGYWRDVVPTAVIETALESEMSELLQRLVRRYPKTDIKQSFYKFIKKIGCMDAKFVQSLVEEKRFELDFKASIISACEHNNSDLVEYLIGQEYDIKSITLNTGDVLEIVNSYRCQESRLLFKVLDAVPHTFGRLYIDQDMFPHGLFIKGTFLRDFVTKGYIQEEWKANIVDWLDYHCIKKQYVISADTFEFVVQETGRSFMMGKYHKHVKSMCNTITSRNTIVYEWMP